VLLPSAATLYPDQPAFSSFELPVSHGHRLHGEQWGNPGGIGAVVLHGGPGSGSSPLLRRFFDPARYHVVSFDQRGAGRSQPAGGTQHNTTPHLLEDLRQLRQHLGITRWLVVGGSWGAALALAHAADEPHAVAGLLLRAVFLARDEDVQGFFRGADGQTLLPGFVRALLPDDPQLQHEAARAWWQWESAKASASPAPAPPIDALVQRYRIQSHYLQNRCWLQAPPLLERCAAVPPVPTLLLHGSEDRVCLPQAALALHRRLPHSRLQWVEGTGHDPTHPAMAAAMVQALDHFAVHGVLA
jgi:proline iminopeptidase